MVDAAEMLDSFGAAVTSGNAALFVGAGLSSAAGYPDWNELLRLPAERACVPMKLEDLPLLAEYCASALPGGRDELVTHLLAELANVEPTPTEGHRSISRLGLAELWTTNYDPLIEMSVNDTDVVVRDGDLLRLRTPGRRRLIKMHGSFQLAPAGWEQEPVIMRSDYERYPERHPRLWHLLQATFLTRSFLFLGFSFTDPNVEVLLRLARTQIRREEGRAEHFTVMRRPVEPVQQALYAHRVRDLEASGIGVVSIDDHDYLVPLLDRLVRRTRPPVLFVSGSDAEGTQLEPAATMIGHRLAELASATERLHVWSMAGPAGMAVSFAFGNALRAVEQYEPDRMRFHFRRKSERAPELPQRTGVVVHSDEDEDALRRRLIDESRAVLALGGGERTLKEIALAEELGVPVVPLGVTGGAAQQAWQERVDRDPPVMFGEVPVDPRDYRLLGDDSVDNAVGAAVRLIRQATFLT